MLSFQYRQFRWDRSICLDEVLVGESFIQSKRNWNSLQALIMTVIQLSTYRSIHADDVEMY